jgi:hypothetical protein
MDRIDIGTLTSRAIATWETEAPRRQESMARLEENLRAAIAGWKKQEIADDITKVNPDYAATHLTGKESKEELATKYIEASITHAAAGTELRHLEEAARCDRSMATKVNEALDTARDARDALIAELQKGNVAYAVARKGDPAAISAELAVYARHVLREVEAGVDIRDAANGVMVEALQAVKDLPRHLRSNGLSGTGNAENLWNVQGAQEFVRMVVRAYGDAMTVSVADIY